MAVCAKFVESLRANKTWFEGCTLGPRFRTRLTVNYDTSDLQLKKNQNNSTVPSPTCQKRDDAQKVKKSHSTI